MKQKLVIKMSFNDEKYRSKALKVIVGVQGVESAALQGQDKNQIEVTGDGVDAVALTKQLRKNVGFAELVSVSAVGEKKDDKKETGGGEKKPEATPQAPLFWYYQPIPPQYVDYGEPYGQSCSIM